jgi:DUF4097 and DUF4098 domain-containing protein YvlB
MSTEPSSNGARGADKSRTAPRRSARTIAIVGGLAATFFVIAAGQFWRALATPTADAQVLAGSDSSAALQIEGFVGLIDVKDGQPGTAIKVDVTPGKTKLPQPVVKTNGDRTRISFDKRLTVERCNKRDDKMEVKLRGYDKAQISDFARLAITVPPGTDIDLNLVAGKARIATAAQASLTLSGCGEVKVDTLTGPSRLVLAGSGDIEVGKSVEIDAVVAGSGDIEIKTVTGPAALNISGTGDIDIDTINGSLAATVVGSGDISIDKGTVSAAKVSIVGSGDVAFGGVAQSLDGSIIGSGDIAFASVTGEVKQSKIGSGDFSIGR